MTLYTAESIKRIVEVNAERLFAPWLVGRPDTYVASPGLKSLVSLGYFLHEELTKIAANEDDRRTQEQKYNRLSRTYDIWESAAECLNDVILGTIPKFDGRRCKRWG